jgi:hypothetical protein
MIDTYLDIRATAVIEQSAWSNQQPRSLWLLLYGMSVHGRKGGRPDAIRAKYSIQLPQIGASWYLLCGYDRNLRRRACFEDNFPYLDSSASFQEGITEQRPRNVRFEASK